ncbi:MAG TPA: CDP-alcohol phosphatidyltransferase family protein [Thermoanaerobaculia bacterium]|nr:CDP-alcohol phosphatidyltransferase family protein [Thermoanaerobaculia bacterium]
MITTRWRTWLAASVHGYTITGGVLGVGAILQAAERSFDRAFVYLLLALIIDVTDGRLARAVGVAEHTPTVDGERLDALVDFLTFAVAPTVIAAMADLFPTPPFLWGAAMVGASLVRFTRRVAKGVGYYSRFPNVWNITVMYAFYLQWSPMVVGTIVVVVIALMLLPGRYPHPSKHATRRLHLVIATVGIGIVAGVLLGALPSRPWLLLSLVYPAFYVGQVLWLSAGATRRLQGPRRWFLLITGNYR